MNREQLIEKARVAYVEAWEAEEKRIENWDRDDRGKHTRSRAGIKAAFAVFEQASLNISDAHSSSVTNSDGSDTAFDPHTSLDLIAELRQARECIEKEMHARELHHFEEEQKAARYKAALDSIQRLLPGPRTFAETLTRDHSGRMFPRTIDGDKVSDILARALNEKEAN